jgi:hypothetical protein
MNHELAYFASALSLAGILLAIMVLLSATGAARVAVAVGAATGCGIAMLGWRLLRESAGTESSSERRRQLG